MKTYLVAGNHAVFGTAPGEKFTADLDPWVEDTLVSGGHIKVAKPDKETKSDEE